MYEPKQLTLTSVGLIDAVHLRLELEPSGWALFIIHRHEHGGWTDCDADTYTELTLDEAMDVIDATAHVWGHADSGYPGGNDFVRDCTSPLYVTRD